MRCAVRATLGLYHHLQTSLFLKSCQIRWLHVTAANKLKQLSFWEQFGEAEEKPAYNWENFKKGLTSFKNEIKRYQKEVYDRFTVEKAYHLYPYQLHKLFTLNSAEELRRWCVTTDSTHSRGGSSAELVLGPTGCAVFRGTIDTSVPKTGKHLARAGFCNMSRISPQKSFGRETAMDWTLHSHVVVRVRGDGRTYMMLLGARGTLDMSLDDMFGYPLYTRGGPYWQTTRIPFSKFVFMNAGRVQDKQFCVNLQRVTSVGFSVARVGGPFQLEVDYIGIEWSPEHREWHAYEMYRTPVGVSGN